MIKKLLQKLWVLQEISNKGKDPKLGKGYMFAYRFNRYNPLSYLTIVIALIIGVLMFGFVGIKKEMDFANPFKWN